jgi:DNA-binding beta-propeller fold protein YncE
MVLGPGGTLYVADFGRDNIGRIETYNVSTGKFQGNLNFDEFSNSAVSNGEFHPRGLVFGPDGGLYITLFSEKNFPLFGWVLRYDLATGGVSVVANNGPTAGAATDCTPHLNAPEGLAFGPDGRLYVATLRATPDDVDRVLVLSPTTGRCLDTIELYRPGELRVRAHAIVFGPGGSLFVPLDASASDGSVTPPQRAASGAIRR